MMSSNQPYRKKLIEVALPLEAINAASAREKSIRHGHPSTLHLWWARRPLAAARAVIFAQMVDDPSSHPDLFPTEKKQEQERQRLFRIIEELVKWENTTNEKVLQKARDEIWQSWRYTCAEQADHPRAAELFDRYRLPAFHDPFAGGGALPLEAQRLGLESYASDLNPVAVLINKAMIEIPPKFAGKPPVNPGWQDKSASEKMGYEWKGAQGLADDVRYYGQWMRDEAEKRIGHLYPKIEVTDAMAEERPDLKKYVGRKLTVIAWLWARTVKSPNPAFADVDVPLASTFMLSTKAGKEAYVQPVIEDGGYRFTVKVGKPKDEEGAKNGTKLSRGANFRCLMSGSPVSGDYIKAEGKAGRMGERLMAIVAEGDRGRVYLSPTQEMEAVAKVTKPNTIPEAALPDDPRNFWTVLYGLKTYADLFTPRQLVALTTFSDLVLEARERVVSQASSQEARVSSLGARTSSQEAQASSLGARASCPQFSLKNAGETPALPGTLPTWHTRGYLPHFEGGAIPQSITFRLHDSLPQHLLDLWREELDRLPETERTRERRERIEAALDAGSGECLLGNPEIGELVEQALLHFHGECYDLHAWVVMPNHVHVLLTPLGEHTLSSILHSWKSWTAKEINGVTGRSEAVWMPEYFDRAIRNQEHYNVVVDYIHNNPVKAGLCAAPEEWPLGSARLCGEGQEELGDELRAGELGEELRAGRPRSQVAYADAVAMYLAFVVDKCSDYWSSICTWHSSGEKMRNTFGRQAIPMTWDYAEANPMCESSGNWMAMVDWTWKSLLAYPATGCGITNQSDAQNQTISVDKVVSTDPPYYDNIGYADLSDFFYVWLRRSLKTVFPELFATLAVPKAEELVATPYRHGGREKAEVFFLDGMTQAMHRLAEQAHPAFPVTIYYAFKQSETGNDDGTTNTGWDTFLAAVIKAGFSVSGTWPMRTELSNRMIGSGTNALASSIVLVCRKRPENAPVATFREFDMVLRSELPKALAQLQAGNIAPVDLAQAAIGPGMAVYTRYASVLDAEGKPLTVRAALARINKVLDDALAEQEGDFDADSRWALAWFEQMGFNDGDFGLADVLARAKATAVDGIVEAGIALSGKGKVRLFRPSELPLDWDPSSDKRLTVWEMVHQLIRVLETGGEPAAAAVVAKLGAGAETARELCYRLYTLCERKKRSQEAISYNALVQSWPEITRLAAETPSVSATGNYNLFENL